MATKETEDKGLCSSCIFYGPKSGCGVIVGRMVYCPDYKPKEVRKNE